MSIRKKILLYFSVTVVLLTGMAFIFVYTLFSEYREAEFQHRQKEKIASTLKFLTEIRNIDEDMIQAMDIVSIHHLYDEKILIFNSDKKIIYSSVDDTPVPFSVEMLEMLTPDEPWIEKKDGLYDVVGVYTEQKGNRYYGISKAYDSFGYSKLRYLKYVLFLTFLGISAATGLIAYMLSKRITRSITDITRQIREYDFNTNTTPIAVDEQNDEVSLLAERFNELMQKLADAFSFQKHAAHHISHELKTPIAVLVSNFDRIEQETDIEKIKQRIRDQKEGTKNLGATINALLEIAKIESGGTIISSRIRIDELIFDLADELAVLYPDFSFSVKYEHATDDDEKLTIPANPRLLKAALMNLMTNCLRYSKTGDSEIFIMPQPTEMRVRFTSKGQLITESEQQFLFQHFFRGQNSKDIPGFGLGLVFISRIIKLHKGTVSYSNDNVDSNLFTITLPLNDFYQH